MVHFICEIFTKNIIKLSSKNSRKIVKKYYPIVSGTCFHHVISFTSSPFGVSFLFHHTQRTLCPNPRIAFYWHLYPVKPLLLLHWIHVRPSRKDSPYHVFSYEDSLIKVFEEGRVFPRRVNIDSMKQWFHRV